MKKKTIMALFLAVLFAPSLWAAAPEAGATAPSFEAESTTGTVRLSDYLGEKNVVLAVYYQDFTPV
jgi:hypothetical protein